MNLSSSDFPIVLGVLEGQDQNGETLTNGVLIETLESAAKQHPAGIRVIHATAGHRAQALARVDSAVNLRAQRSPGDHLPPVSNPEISLMSGEDVELVEASDVTVLLSNGNSTSPTPRESAVRAYACSLNRPVIQLDPGTGRWSEPLPASSEDRLEWLPALFKAAGLKPSADLQSIHEKANALANQAAPVTRRWWTAILAAQAAAVFAPLGWFLTRRWGVPVLWVALGTLATVLVLAGLNWWLRWRGMQKTWVRSRLVAEVARSLLAIASCPRTLILPGMGLVPALRHLRWCEGAIRDEQTFPAWRDDYVRNRIDDQAAYFAGKQAKAEAQRARLTRWATVLLDITLALAAAGAVLFLSPKGRDWSRMFGGDSLQLVLGIAGVALPAGLLLLQALRGVQEVNRRTATFAQQRRMLALAKTRLLSSPTPELALQVVADTEQQLLGEVFDWYFQAETAEHFFHLRGSKESARGVALNPRAATAATAGFWPKVLAGTGLGTFFVLHVVLGRVPWVVGSATAAVAWLAYQHPTDPTTRAELRELGQLRDSAGQPWVPDIEKAENGCVVIVHGLHDDLTFKDPRGRSHWMKDLAAAIEQRFPAATPNIALLDWREAARPSQMSRLSSGSSQTQMILDVAAIRPQAQEVGDFAAMKLARHIMDGAIMKERPLHLIGHSAGGFVITRVAVLLKQFGLAPESLHVTILDTPEPDEEMRTKLPEAVPGAADFYATSSLVRGVAGLSVGGLRVTTIPLPPDKDLSIRGAHSYAHSWFIETVRNKRGEEGFNRSPLLKESAEF